MLSMLYNPKRESEPLLSYTNFISKNERELQDKNPFPPV